jgi:hypothetical protein
MSNRSSRRHARRDHRTGQPSPELPDIFVGTFSDAIVEAAALRHEFGRVFAAYTLDTVGQVTGGWALTAEHHRIEDVVLLVLAGDRPVPGTGVLLVSADRGGATLTMHEEDDLRWSSFRRVLDARGYHLWDWIQVDEEGFRSMCFGRNGSVSWPAPPIGIT